MPDITRPLPYIPPNFTKEEVAERLPSEFVRLANWMAQQITLSEKRIRALPEMTNTRVAHALKAQENEIALDFNRRMAAGSVFVIIEKTEGYQAAFVDPTQAFPDGTVVLVTPHNLLSNTHPDTEPKTPPDVGDIIAGDGTNWGAVGVGFDGDVLTADSGDPRGVSWQPASGGGPHDLLDGDQNQDTLAAAVSRGSLIAGNSTPLWAELVLGSAGKVLYSDGTDALWSSTLAEELTFDKSLILKGIAFEQDTPLPARPSSGYGKLFADLLGRTWLAQYGEFGMMQHLQGLVGHSGACAILPGTGTAPNVWGTAVGTASGTVSHPALATTNYSTSVRRIRVTSLAATNSSSSLFENQLHWWLGNAANRGGFKISMRFFTSADPSVAAFWFVGLHGSVATIGNTAPSNLGNCIGVGMEDVAGTPDTVLNIFHNDAAGGATKVPCTGIGWTSTNIYQLDMVAAPNSTEVAVRVTRIDDPSVGPFEAVLNSNLPTGFLAMHFHSNTGATDSGPVVLHPIRAYGETDI